MLNIKKITLPNKLRIITVPMKSTEAITVIIMARAGSRYETKDINGIAHFLEHMFFKGGERYPTPRLVAEAIDSVGGSFNAFTGEEYAGYYIKVAKEKIELAFDVLSDMLLNAKFDAEALNRERGVILEEYNMYEDTPMALIQDLFTQVLFGDQPIGWPVIGKKPVINSVKREDFIAYQNRYYTASNIVVSVAGNTTLTEVKKLAKKYLPFRKSGIKNMPLSYSAARSKPSKKIKVVHKKTEQAHFQLGVPLFGALHPDRYVSTVLAVILGGGMSSRLFTSIRERQGLAYYVGASANHYTDTGYFVVRAGVTVSKINLAIKTVLDEFKEISAELVTQKELKKAKENMIGNMVLKVESSDAVATGVASMELLFDKIETIPEIKRKIRAVTAKQIQNLAKRIFKDNKLALVVIGPYKNDKNIKTAFNL